MSNRLAVMQIIAKNPHITQDEVVAILGIEKKYVQWTIGNCKQGALIKVERDDVTGKPSYMLTDKGKAWLVNRPMDNTEQDTSQPAVEESNAKVSGERSESAGLPGWEARD